MARDVFGNKKVTKEDLYTKKRVSRGDVRSEYSKLILWLLGGYLYLHFVMGVWAWY